MIIYLKKSKNILSAINAKTGFNPAFNPATRANPNAHLNTFCHTFPTFGSKLINFLSTKAPTANPKHAPTDLNVSLFFAKNKAVNDNAAIIK